MTQVETKARRDIDILRDELTQMQGQFEMALPKQVPIDRFVRVTMTAVQTNPDLLRCDRRSLWNALMKCAQDGLLPDAKEAVILPFKTKVKRQGQDEYALLAQYVPMIGGLRKKARNSGQISDWYVDVIFEKDEWDYQRGDEQFLKHRPNLLAKDRGPIIAAYSVCVFKDGMKSLEAMSVHEIERIRNLSKVPDGPGWKGHYVEMCKKTVARRHSKILPTSTDLDDLLRRDDEVHGSADFADRTQITGAARPQLVDFTGQQPQEQGQEGAEGSTKEQDRAEPQADEQKQTEDAKAADDAKSKKPAKGKPAEPEQDATAAAFEQGRSDRRAGKMYPPLNLREDPVQKNAWQAGWDKENEEMKSQPK